MAANPGTVSEPNAERQQTAEEQRILAQRQREREENDAAWLRYLDSIRPGILAEQERKRLQRLAEEERKRLQRLSKCQTANFCIDSFLPSPTVSFTGAGTNNSQLISFTQLGGISFPPSNSLAFQNSNRDFNAEVRALDSSWAYSLDAFGFGELDYLVFGAWALAANPLDRGGFALGREFPVADLPTTGTASYQGRGRILTGLERGSDAATRAVDDFYTATAEFTATFAADNAHTLSGTLTETTATPKFILEFGESAFRLGEFSGGKVSCGTGGQCDDSGIADNFYNAKFFGTAGTGGNPTKLGGTFKASGLSLDGKDAANVVGGFGGELQ